MLSPLAGHVALDRRDRGVPVRARTVGHEVGQQEQGDEAHEGGEDEQAGAPAGGHQPGQQAPGQGQQEAESRGADVGQGIGDRGVDGGEGEPPPGHAAERPAAAHHLHGGPGGGHPERPEASAAQHRHDGAQEAVEQRLDPGEGGPGVDADRTHPPDQQEVEAHAERESRDPGPGRGEAANAQDVSGDGDREQPGGRDRLEGQGGGHAGHQREDRPEEHVRKGSRAPAPAERRKGPAPFGPTRDRPAAEVGLLSRGRAALPYPPSRGEPTSANQFGRVIGPPPSDTATRTSVRRPRSA